MTQHVVYDARYQGTLETVAGAWWAWLVIAVCVANAYMAWSARSRPSSFSARREAAGKPGPWRMHYPVSASLGGAVLVGGIVIAGANARWSDAARLSTHDYQEWTGILDQDVIESLSTRSTGQETDDLDVSGKRFRIYCRKSPGYWRLGDPATCPPFHLGDLLTVRFIMLPHGRYKMSPLQVLRAQ